MDDLTDIGRRTERKRKKRETATLRRYNPGEAIVGEALASIERPRHVCYVNSGNGISVSVRVLDQIRTGFLPGTRVMMPSIHAFESVADLQAKIPREDLAVTVVLTDGKSSMGRATFTPQVRSRFRKTSLLDEAGARWGVIVNPSLPPQHIERFVKTCAQSVWAWFIKDDSDIKGGLKKRLVSDPFVREMIINGRTQVMLPWGPLSPGDVLLK